MKTAGEPDEALLNAVMAYCKQHDSTWSGLCVAIRRAGWEPIPPVLARISTYLLSSQHPDSKRTLRDLAMFAFIQLDTYSDIVSRLRDINYLLNAEHIAEFNTLVDRVTKLEGGEVDDSEDDAE